MFHHNNTTSFILFSSKVSKNPFTAPASNCFCLPLPYHTYTFTMIRQGIIGIWRFYRDGFRSMTLGRTLWAVILIKLSLCSLS